MGKTRWEQRMEREARLINRSPVTLTPADIAKIFKVSKPTALSDVDHMIKSGMVKRHKVRRGWKVEDMIKGIDF